MSKIIGIDLGTTNSVVSVLEDSEARVLENPEGNRTTPSVVSFSENKIVVGDAAKRQSITNLDTILSIKRLMGTNEIVTIQNKKYKPEQISAMILSHLKEYAEKKLGEKVTRAVITVPAYFNDAQRNATKIAGKIAGLKVERIINEPTAAALAYGINNKEEARDEIVLVYDLGGGTFDVSILELVNGTFRVLSTSGNNKIGGDDFDKIIMDIIFNRFEKENGTKLQDNKLSVQRVKEAAEKAKKELSGLTQTKITLPFISQNSKGPIHLELTIKRSEFEALLKPFIEKTIKSVRNAIEDSGVKGKGIDQVLLVGGSTRIPLIKKVIQKELNKEANSTLNPDEVVSIGAAIQGGILSGKVQDVVLLDVTPLTLGVETSGGIVTPLIERNTTIPVLKSQIFTTSSDNQPKVDVHVLQGERVMVKDNKSLGHFLLEGIQPAPKGIPQIRVTFSIDVNGIVAITAKNLQNSKKQSIVISDSNSLSEQEIKAMIKEAEKNKAHDEKLKKESEIINQAELSIDQFKIIREHAIKNNLGQRAVMDINNKIKKMEDLIEERNIAEISVQLNAIKSVIYGKDGASSKTTTPPKKRLKSEKSKSKSKESSAEVIQETNDSNQSNQKVENSQKKLTLEEQKQAKMRSNLLNKLRSNGDKNSNTVSYDLTEIYGVGPKTAEYFKKNKINTIEELANLKLNEKLISELPSMRSTKNLAKKEKLMSIIKEAKYIVSEI